MAVGPVRIPQLQQTMPIVDADRRMTNEFARRLNEVLDRLAYALNQILLLPLIQDALANLDQATMAAQQAAAAATQAAQESMQATEATKREAALQGSYIEPDSVLTASPTTITIANHIRHYADGTMVNVTGATIAATASGDTDYVSYSDPMRTGGVVSYQASTDAPTQTGNTHVVGAVMIPATGTSNGGSGPRRPGYVSAEVQQ